MSGFARIAVAVVFWSVAAAGARAATITVFGGDLARACFQAAKFGDVRSDANRDCTLAIETEPLSTRDLAGTYVNRGVVYMQHQAWRDAQADFETAMKLMPGLGEAIVNRGAALVAQHRYTDGIADLTRGLALSPEEPEKAYFNRALAYEGLNDEKSAYFDYLKASEIAPKWTAPRDELARFTVVQR